MSRDEEKRSNEYKVGKGNPPKEHQFRKGKSGNPRGRPPKKTHATFDAISVLNEELNVQIRGKKTKASAFEVSFRKTSKLAVDGKIGSIRRFLNQSEKFDLIGPPELDQHRSVVHAPKGVNFRDWFEEETELIPEDEQ